MHRFPCGDQKKKKRGKNWDRVKNANGILSNAMKTRRTEFHICNVYICSMSAFFVNHSWDSASKLGLFAQLRRDKREEGSPKQPAEHMENSGTRMLQLGHGSPKVSLAWAEVLHAPEGSLSKFNSISDTGRLFFSRRCKCLLFSAPHFLSLKKLIFF